MESLGGKGGCDVGLWARGWLEEDAVRRSRLRGRLAAARGGRDLGGGTDLEGACLREGRGERVKGKKGRNFKTGYLIE